MQLCLYLSNIIGRLVAGWTPVPKYQNIGARAARAPQSLCQCIIHYIITMRPYFILSHQISAIAVISRLWITLSTCARGQSLTVDSQCSMRLMRMQPTGWTIWRWQHLWNKMHYHHHQEAQIYTLYSDSCTAWCIVTKMLKGQLEAKDLAKELTGTHTRSTFALVLHHILSIVFLKPTALIRPSVPPSGRAHTSTSDSAFGRHCAL